MIAFQFVPFLQVYWWFVAYWQWAQDWNMATANQPWAQRMPEGQFLATAFAGAATTILPGLFFFVPLDSLEALTYTQGVVTGIFLVLYAMTVNSMCKAVNSAIEHEWGGR